MGKRKGIYNKRNSLHNGVNSRRLSLIYYGFIVSFFVLVLRLFYWQIVRGKELSILARSQYTSRSTIGTSRGDILASDKTWLSASDEAWLGDIIITY